MYLCYKVYDDNGELVEKVVRLARELGREIATPDEAAAAKAVQNAAQCRVPMPEHFHIEVDFIKHHVAYSRSFYPGASLKDGKFVCFDSDDWYEVLRFCHFVLSD